MKIMMAASESLPFSKTGGLADVVHALSEQLAKNKNNEVSVFIPYFFTDKSGREIKLKQVGKFNVHMGKNSFPTIVFKAKIQRVDYYLIKSENFFDRDNLYGYFDDGERFAYFVNAILKFAVRKKMTFDIIHTHDWHVGMIPCILKEKPEFKGVFGETKTIFTIHNPLFKGMFGPESLDYFYKLDQELFENGMLAYDGMVSTFKAALVYADKVTTVSPTHAKELLTKESNFNIELLLQDRKDDFVGILNGMYYSERNPKKDKEIHFNYGIKDVDEGKNKNKFTFERAHMLIEGRPIFAVVSRLSEQKGINQILDMADYIVKRGGLFVILGAGEKWAEEHFRHFREIHKKHCYIYLGYYNELAHRIYASADFILMPSLFEPCGLTQMISQKYGAIPIVRKVGGLADTVNGYVPELKNQSEATGIMFENVDKEASLWAIRTAFKLYKKPRVLKRIRKNCMKIDRSWKVSAEEYYKLYEKALQK